MRHFFLFSFLIIFVIIFGKQLFLVQGDVGTASSYNPPYLPTACNGDRQDQFPPGNLFVAVNEGLWDNGAACGRRYRLRCLSGAHRPCRDGTIDVKVVDFCKKTPCPSTIVLSTDAFSAISRPHAKKINIEYTQKTLMYYEQIRVILTGEFQSPAKKLTQRVVSDKD
ncbi:hypothetical protein ACFE04_013052 [Oxalis oulophora]